MTPYKSIEWLNNKNAIRLIDQSSLPNTVNYKTYNTVEGIADAIRKMVVRGAPVIGVSAAYGLAIAALQNMSDDIKTLQLAVYKADALLRASRPTAVNLFWALDEMKRRVNSMTYSNTIEYKKSLLQCAHALAKEDIAINKHMAKTAMTLMPKDKVTFIHHCNTGALATVGYGTALGIIRMAHESGLNVHVFVNETRPLLQGARLTCWELKEQGISHQLIVDSASSHVMQNFPVDMCVVGCDRVAANGDVANKIGTCNLAAVARVNNVPFYVASPLSSIDLDTSCSDDIEIELRNMEEITMFNNTKITPDSVDAYNPAFDITPASLIDAIITEQGIIYPPFKKNLRKTKEET